MKHKLGSTIVKCRICGDSHAQLYKDVINHDVYLCKKCKEFLDYERNRYTKKENQDAGKE